MFHESDDRLMNAESGRMNGSFHVVVVVVVVVVEKDGFVVDS